MNAIDYLSRHGGTLLLGSTVLLLLGAVAVVFQRSPLHRQRLGELAVLAVLLWLPLASIPMPRLGPGDAEVESRVLDVPETRMPSSSPQATVAPPLPAALLDVLEGREKSVSGIPAIPVPEAFTHDEPVLFSREVSTSVALEPETLLPGLDAPPAARLEGLAAEPPVTAVRWDRIAASFYLIGAAACAAYLALGRLLLARTLRGARKAEPWLESLFNSLTPGSTRRSRALLLVADARIRPLSCGLWRAKVVLPLSSCRAERAGELRQVLLHELTHVERRDALGAFVLNLAFPLLYFNPIYWFLRARVRLSAELIADDQAASHSSAEEYAAALIHFVRLSRPKPLGAFGVTGMFRSETQFYRRLHMLLHRDGQLSSRSSRGWRCLSLLLAGSAIALVTAVVGVEPVSSQDDAPAEADEAQARLEKERDALNEEIMALREKVRALNESSRLEGEAAPPGKRVPGAEDSPARSPAPRPARTAEDSGRGIATPDGVAPAPGLGESKATGDLALSGERQLFSGALGLDLLQLATAYNDALGEVEIARLQYQSAADTAAQKVAPKMEADVARVRLGTAERKLRILRAIAMAARKSAEANLEAKMKLHDRGYVGRDQIVEAEARLEILLLILDSSGSSSSRVEKRSPEPATAQAQKKELQERIIVLTGALQARRKDLQERITAQTPTYGENSDQVKSLKKQLELLDVMHLSTSHRIRLLQDTRESYQELLLSHMANHGEYSDSVKFFKNRVALFDEKLPAALQAQKDELQKKIMDETATHGESSEPVEGLKKLLDLIDAKLLLAMKDVERPEDFLEVEIGKGPREPRKASPPAHPIEGLVSAVKPDMNLVVLTVGHEQKVEIGYELTISRGDKLIGKVKVLKVFPEMSGAEILSTQEGEEVQQGDKATTSN